MNRPAIAYIRQPKADEGHSGVGVSTQREAIARFAEATGYELTHEYFEIESTRGAGRPDAHEKLRAAVEEARSSRLPIIVATLDCLCCHVELVSELTAQNVRFVVAERGVEVDPDMLQAYAALARIRRRMSGTPIEELDAAPSIAEEASEYAGAETPEVEDSGSPEAATSEESLAAPEDPQTADPSMDEQVAEPSEEKSEVEEAPESPEGEPATPSADRKTQAFPGLLEVLDLRRSSVRTPGQD